MTEIAAARVAVVVFASPQPAVELVDLIGESRARALGRLQSDRAQAWASMSFPAERVQLRAGGFAELIRDVDPIGLDDVLVVVAPELASWRADLGPAALDDLQTGCALSIGPIFDGGLYLLVATGPGLQLLRDGSGDDAGADGADLTGPAAMARLIGLAERAGIEVGLLRTERGLQSAGDARALLADPLTDGELRRLLRADWGEGT